MVVREVLETEGVDLSQFTNSKFNPNKIRRSYEKMPGKSSSFIFILKEIINNRFYTPYLAIFFTEINFSDFSRKRHSRKNMLVH